MRDLSQRNVNEVRQITIQPGFSPSGCSVLIGMGETIVQCSASVEERTPPFVEDGLGWLTAEYAMLPSSTSSRSRRDRGSKPNSRSVEIQRLIGRSLRAIVDFEKLGPRTVTIDCDVLKADGGTRCASISGAYLSLCMILAKLEKNGTLQAKDVLRDEVAAVSVGIVEGKALLDLQYTEDFAAEVDMNVVMTGRGQFVEIQGTAEEQVFSREQLNDMLALAEKGVHDILAAGRTYLQSA